MQKNGHTLKETIREVFAAHGKRGGISRSKKKIAAARKNALIAAAARKKTPNER